MKPEDAHWTCPNHPLAGPGVSGRAVAPLCHRPGCDYKTTMVMVHGFGCDGTHEVGDCNRLAIPAEPRPLTDLIGLDPNFTGGLSADEHLRRQRCGECDEALKERDAARSKLDAMKADAAEKFIQGLVDETTLRSLDFRNGKASMDMGVAREIAAAFVAAARTMLGDAPNYTETKVALDVKVAESPELYTFVVQRHAPGVLTPHEARQKAEAELARLVQAVQFVHAEYAGRCVSCEERCDCLDLDDNAKVADCTHGNAEWPCTTIQQINAATTPAQVSA